MNVKQFHGCLVVRQRQHFALLRRENLLARIAVKGKYLRVTNCRKALCRERLNLDIEEGNDRNVCKSLSAHSKD